MSIIRTISLVTAVAVSTLAVGCSSETDDSDKVALSGKVAGGSTVAPKAFGGVVVANGGLHVVARKLHRRGEAGALVDVPVNADGSFRLEVPRDSRWVVTVDGANASSALVSFASGKSVLSVAGSGVPSVDLGAIDVVGGEAYSKLSVEGLAGLDATLAEADEIFQAANGAIANAREAADEARKAADAARAAAEKARGDADAARKAAEEAAEKARQAAGG
ncbi:MAG: hypothetical protein JST00_29775 [Deltaproteobacteria bacterium]|nr:hypothetical protein [Deltaproteobacteria bacterium]